MMNKSKKCEFVGDANTKNGRIVPCNRNAMVRMRLRGLDSKHMELLLSPEVRAAKRDWQIDAYL